ARRGRSGGRRGEAQGASFADGVYGTGFSRQNLQTCDSEPDVHLCENKYCPSGDVIGTGGALSSKLHKDSYKSPVELLADLRLSKNTSRRTQLNQNNDKEGTFNSWGYTHNQVNATVNRDISKPQVKTVSGLKDISLNFFTFNCTLAGVHMNKYQTASYPGVEQAALGIYWTNGNGDFCKARNEAIASSSYSAAESNSNNTRFVSRRNLTSGKSSSKDKLLTEESNESKSEKADEVFPTYAKNMTLNLRPKTAENIKEAFYKRQNEEFSYPDFLPSPFNKLDLQKLSHFDKANWKALFDPPPEDSMVKLISRLLEMERMQHLTVLKERVKDLTVSSPVPVGSRPSSLKPMLQLKQPRPSESVCPQTVCNGDYQEKSRSSPSAFCTLEWTSSKSIKQHRASGDTFKRSKVSTILNSNHMLSRRSSSCAPKTQSAVQMTSKLLPPSTAIACSFPEKDCSKYKKPKNKKKLYKKNVGTGKLFHCQKVKALSTLPKQKCSQSDKW
ncbi:PREDICTED: LOW QUALITY PROTEIN: protein FAM217A, partial [Crocodylus porosus]|uniref:LOW QUALITY PROTEIN: protein FAM217A n=1 Tax=Crocodylus porosus TaxID=8502 RepID=UPI00093E3099